MLAQKIAFHKTIVASSSFKKSSDNLPAWFEPWSSSTCQLLSFSDSVNLIFLTRNCSRMSKSGLPPTRAPTLSTLDQLDKWKEEGETRARWGALAQPENSAQLPIIHTESNSVIIGGKGLGPPKVTTGLRLSYLV